MDLPPITPPPRALPVARAARPEDGPAAAEQAARETAKEFEAAFLAEMLKYTGINKTPEENGGGAGEDAFGSFLTDEYARLIADKGGIGLAEQIFNAIQHKGSGS